MNINTITLSGNVGQDPMIREFENGKIASFSVAYTEKGFTTKDGKVIEDKTYWFDVQARNGYATYVEKAVSKGCRVTVSGKLKSREYTDKNGVKKTYTFIEASVIDSIKRNPSEQTQEQVPPPPIPDDLPF